MHFACAYEVKNKYYMDLQNTVFIINLKSMNSGQTNLEQFDENFGCIKFQEGLLTLSVVGCHGFQSVGSLHLYSDITTFD